MQSLKTSFEIKDGEPVQKIDKDIAFSVDYYEKDEKSAKEIVTDFVKPFDLSKAPLLRVSLIKTGKARYILMLDMHHIITDGISHEILTQEFISLYSGERLPDLRLQYKDYAQWQHKESEREKVKHQQAYWLKEFSDDTLIPHT